MNDGTVVKDSSPYVREESIEEPRENEHAERSEEKTKKRSVKKAKKGRTSRFHSSYMNFRTALRLSFKNLVSKKRRTVLTSIAGSAGIIGLGLVLAFSNGINIFLERMQNSLLASIPVGIYEYSMDYSVLMDIFMSFGDKLAEEGEFPADDSVHLVPANGRTRRGNYRLRKSE